MKMKVLKTIAEVKAFVRQIKKEGKSIGLVPTMGSLHEGHLTLMRAAKGACDVVIASVFVNPTQFGPQEDFDAYPRDFSGDCAKLDGEAVDAVFHPSAAEMYPEGYASFVEVESALTNRLCGARRPGHFRGVATVVTKLINISEADKIFMGQKDAQQVVVVRRFVHDLNLNAEVQMVPIVRAADGLALSSRNQYLSAAERQAALALSAGLREARAAFAAGEKDAAKLRELLRRRIQSEPLSDIDYIEIYSFPRLEMIERIDQPALVALAVRFGRTRLIDNMILEEQGCC